MDVYGIKDFPEVEIGGTIKEKPEDFIVEEVTPSGKTCNVKTGIFDMVMDILPQKYKEHIHFTLVKRNYTTHRAIKQISSKLRIGHKRFGYAGIKDKKALTAQKISVWNQKIENLKKLKMKDLTLKNFEYSNKRITLGNLKANRFTITIRNVQPPKEEIKERIARFQNEIAFGLPNYFGPQRFGRQRPVNHLIGKELLLGNFENAVKILITAPGNESEESGEARAFAKKNWKKWKEILNQWPRHLGIEAAIINYLVKYPTDYANAFRKLPKNLRRLFLHAFQSYIFNKTLTRIIEQKHEYPETIQLVGYETDLDSTIGNFISQILKEENIKPEQFRLPSMPELAEPGSDRAATIEIENFKVLKIDKELLKIRFTLGKGSYATVLMKALLGDYDE